jgi:hypothetical protein
LTDMLLIPSSADTPSETPGGFLPPAFSYIPFAEHTSAL